MAAWSAGLAPRTDAELEEAEITEALTKMEDEKDKERWLQGERAADMRWQNWLITASFVV